MGRNILITGGTDGIGYELVKRMVMRHKIMVVGRTPNEELLKLEELTGNLIIVKTDLSDPVKATKAIDKAMTKAKWFHLDNAILNAGTGFVIDPTQETPQSIRKTLDVNLAANIAIAGMIFHRLQQVRGKITFIGSVARKGKSDFASYAGSKAGLHGFARALRQEWRGKAGVQIMHIGPTSTKMHEKAGLKLGAIRNFFTTPKVMAGLIEKNISSRRFSIKLSLFHEWTGSNYFSRGLH